MAYKVFTETDSLMASLFGFADGRADHRGDATGGNEVRKTYDSDPDYAEIRDPVSALFQKYAANRLGTETRVDNVHPRKSAGVDSWDEPLGDEPKQISKAVRYEVETDENGFRTSKGYDAKGELVSWRWLIGKE